MGDYNAIVPKVKPLVGWRTRFVEEGSCTVAQYAVLDELILQGGWVEIKRVHGNVLTSLQRRDLIVRSDGIDGSVAYRVTNRGRRLYEAVRAVGRNIRQDGLCPICGERSRYVDPKTGRATSYCRPCRKAKSREWHRRQRSG